MRDEAWAQQRLRELRAGITELQQKIAANQGAIAVLEELIAPDPADAGLSLEQLQAIFPADAVIDGV